MYTIENEDIKDKIIPRINELLSDGLSSILRTFSEIDKYFKKKKTPLF